MLRIDVHMIMGEAHITAQISSSDGAVGTRVTWQGALDEGSPVDELTSHVTNALLALDRVMGEVHEELLFGS